MWSLSQGPSRFLPPYPQFPLVLVPPSFTVSPSLPVLSTSHHLSSLWPGSVWQAEGRALSCCEDWFMTQTWRSWSAYTPSFVGKKKQQRRKSGWAWSFSVNCRSLFYNFADLVSTHCLIKHFAFCCLISKHRGERWLEVTTSCLLGFAKWE